MSTCPLDVASGRATGCTSKQRVWFGVPGMYGGFSITLMDGLYLYVVSWIRVVGDSGQAHVVTHAGATLVDEGFV